MCFQYDNDPEHTAEVSIQGMKDKKLKGLEWPSQSTAVHLIENLWTGSKRKGERTYGSIFLLIVFFSLCELRFDIVKR